MLGVRRTEPERRRPLCSLPREARSNASIRRAVPVPCWHPNSLETFAMKFPICVVHRKRTASFRIVSWLFTIVPLWLMLVAAQQICVRSDIR